MSAIPEAIMDEAKLLRSTVLWASNSSIEAISLAILAAEQRGAERERERACLIVRRVAKIVGNHLSDLATPELLNTLADAINAENRTDRCC
jgi:hypothetical protein